jgi:hypothetical protein
MFHPQLPRTRAFSQADRWLLYHASPMPGVSFELCSPFIERDGVAEGTDDCVGCGEGELSLNSKADRADGVPEKT